MKRTVLPLSLLIVVLWAVLQSAGILDFSQTYFPLRKAYTTLTGALALGWMGVSMLLALRPVWLERSLGGLDKLYKLLTPEQRTKLQQNELVGGRHHGGPRMPS